MTILLILIFWLLCANLSVQISSKFFDVSASEYELFMVLIITGPVGLIGTILALIDECNH